MNKDKKTRGIFFRVTEEEYAAIERAAMLSGSNPTDWSRDATIEKATEPEAMLSAGERLLFYELTKVRFLLGNGFSLMAAQTLTPATWDQLRKQASELVQEIARSLISTYDSHWFFSTATSSNRGTAATAAAIGADDVYADH